MKVSEKDFFGVRPKEIRYDDPRRDEKRKLLQEARAARVLRNKKTLGLATRAEAEAVLLSIPLPHREAYEIITHSYLGF